MITFVHLVGNVAVWTAFWASVLFCGLYAVLARWRESAEGWHLMTFTATIAVAFGWIAYRQTTSKIPPASLSIEIPRAVILGALAALLVWRLLLLIQAQTRRRGTAMTIFGVDYSSSRPSHTALKAAGVKFVCRYIGSQVRKAGRDAKWLSPSEAKSLHADGFDIVVVFETSARRAEAGHAAGAADAHTAAAELAYCGLPADTVVYFAVDYDTTVGPNVTGYFQGVASVLGLARTGGYAGYKVIKALFDKKLITYGWQTYAWSGGKWDSRAHLQQYSNNKTIGGASVDYDRAMKAEYGQWPAAGTPAPAGPPKWPGRYLKVASPLMHGSDVKWVQGKLNSHGASPKLTVDSQYGPKTRDAVKTFQRKQKLEADGIVGKLTWAALGK